MITTKNILQHEIIGLNAKVEESTDEKLCGVEGKIVDETQNMLTIRKSDTHEIQVAKKNQTFILMLLDKTKVRILGNLLQGDPIERLKKKQPKKWD